MKGHGRRLNQSRSAHHGQRPGIGHADSGFLLDAETVHPCHQRAEQQLVVQQNHDQHGGDRPADCAKVFLLNGECDIGTDAGQRNGGVSDADRFRGDHEEPAAGHRHHHVPNERRHAERHLQLPEAHPRRQPKRLARFREFDGYRAQRLIKAEGHVPRLAGEDGEYGREFGAEHPSGSQGHEEHDCNGNETQNRHRLQNIQDRHQQLAGPLALGGPRRICQSEYQRENEPSQHAKRGACRIFRQMRGIQRQRHYFELRKRGEQPPRCLAQEGDQADHDDECQHVPARREVAEEDVGREAIHRRILAGQLTK